MDKDNLQISERIVNIIGKLLSFAKLYNHQHPVVKTNISDGFKEIQELILNKESLILSESAGAFYVNGQEIPAQSGLEAHVAESLNNLRIGSLELETALSQEEFSCFIELLSNTQHLEGEKQIKQYLNDNGAKHIVAHFAVYELVEEDESIVKEIVPEVDELPTNIVETFLQDLNKGEVAKQLSGRDRIYSSLAHNPNSLAKIIVDLTKDKDSYGELIRILWLIGDYLLDEIHTATEEESNRKVLNELKGRLFSLYEQKKEKQGWEEEIQKTFTAINAALQIKGLILLYKKHKKELESVSDRIAKILKLLPQESQLYRKSKEELAKIGAPVLDTSLFNPP